MTPFDAGPMLVGFLGGALLGALLGLLLGVGAVRALDAGVPRGRRRAAARVLDAEATRLRAELGPPGPLMFHTLVARQTGVPSVHPIVHRSLREAAGALDPAALLAFLRLDGALRRLDADLDAVWASALRTVAAGHQPTFGIARHHAAPPAAAERATVITRLRRSGVAAHIAPGSDRGGDTTAAPGVALDAEASDSDVRAATDRCLAGLRHVHALLDEIQRHTHPLLEPPPWRRWARQIRAGCASGARLAGRVFTAGPPAAERESEAS